jgi:hypothetical protein
MILHWLGIYLIVGFLVGINSYLLARFFEKELRRIEKELVGQITELRAELKLSKQTDQN